MFKPIPPWIVFIIDGTEGGGSTSNPDEFLPGDTDLSDDDFLAKRGFPRGTKKDDMTPEQAAASWRYESKKQQHEANQLRQQLTAYTGLGDFDALKQLKATAEAARLGSLPEQERAIEAARTEGAATARAEAAKTYLPLAIEGQLVALTVSVNEKPEDALKRVRGALSFVDVTKFLDENGALDAAQIQTFAQSIAQKDGNGNGEGGDPLHQSFQRQTLPKEGSAGSVAQHRQAAYERRSAKKQ